MNISPSGVINTGSSPDSIRDVEIPRELILLNPLLEEILLANNISSFKKPDHLLIRFESLKFPGGN